MGVKRTGPDSERLDRVVAEARRSRERRERSYREQALKLYPWVCARCGRSFVRGNVHELTVHHKDHDHDNNPSDGSNWELLCLYCHDNEHSRYLEAAASDPQVSHRGQRPTSTHKPFAELEALLKQKDNH
jgi:5-methylcytosine-specific restriction endonuclease McrA